MTRTPVRKLVCSECRTEACAAGILMCENAGRASVAEWLVADVRTYPHDVIADPEIAVPCPACPAPVGDTCEGFGYCPARSEAVRDHRDSDTQPDPYVDAMAAEHLQEYEPEASGCPAVSEQGSLSLRCELDAAHKCMHVTTCPACQHPIAWPRGRQTAASKRQMEGLSDGSA